MTDREHFLSVNSNPPKQIEAMLMCGNTRSHEEFRSNSNMFEPERREEINLEVKKPQKAKR